MSCAIKNGKKGLVVIYAEWCGYCQMLAPEWKKFAKESKYMVKAINADNGSNKKIVNKIGVQGFPTIKYVNSEGKIGETFSGERNIEEFEKYLAKK